MFFKCSHFIKNTNKVVSFYTTHTVIDKKYPVSKIEGKVGHQLIVYQLDFIQPALSISLKKKVGINVMINMSLKLVTINSPCIGNTIKFSVTLPLILNILTLTLFSFEMKRNTKETAEKLVSNWAF